MEKDPQAVIQVRQPAVEPMTTAGENHKGEILAVLEPVSHFVQNSVQKFFLIFQGKVRGAVAIVPEADGQILIFFGFQGFLKNVEIAPNTGEIAEISKLVKAVEHDGIDGGHRAAAQPHKGAMLPGIRRICIGGVGGINQRDDFAPHFLPEIHGPDVCQAVPVPVVREQRRPIGGNGVIGGGNHNAGSAFSPLYHLVKHIAGGLAKAVVPQPVLLLCPGAVEGIDHIVLLAGVVAVGQIDAEGLFHEEFRFIPAQCLPVNGRCGADVVCGGQIFVGSHRLQGVGMGRVGQLLYPAPVLRLLGVGAVNGNLFNKRPVIAALCADRKGHDQNGCQQQCNVSFHRFHPLRYNFLPYYMKTTTSRQEGVTK